MNIRLRTKKAAVVGVIISCVFILLGALIVVWIDGRSSPSCPPESATSYALGTDETWCTPKKEFCEMLRRSIDDGGGESAEAEYRLTCAEFAEPDE